MLQVCAYDVVEKVLFLRHKAKDDIKMLVNLDFFPQSLFQDRPLGLNLSAQPLLLPSIVGGFNLLAKLSDLGLQSSRDIRNRLSDTAFFTLPAGD